MVLSSPSRSLLLLLLLRHLLRDRATRDTDKPEIQSVSQPESLHSVSFLEGYRKERSNDSEIAPPGRFSEKCRAEDAPRGVSRKKKKVSPVVLSPLVETQRFLKNLN